LLFQEERAFAQEGGKSIEVGAALSRDDRLASDRNRITARRLSAGPITGTPQHRRLFGERQTNCSVQSGVAFGRVGWGPVTSGRRVLKEPGELEPVHLARGHGKLIVLDGPATANVTPDRHVVGRVGKDHVGLLTGHEGLAGPRLAGITTDEAYDQISSPQRRAIPERTYAISLPGLPLPEYTLWRTTLA
jgi:hypothetical protein